MFCILWLIMCFGFEIMAITLSVILGQIVQILCFICLCVKFLIIVRTKGDFTSAVASQSVMPTMGNRACFLLKWRLRSVFCYSRFCWKFQVCNKIHHPLLAAGCDGNPFPSVMICVIWSAQVHVMLLIGFTERADWKDPLMLLFKCIVPQDKWLET